jgi:hypothetical protein
MADPDEWDHESDQLDYEDTLDDPDVPDPLDEGISPAERPWIGDGWGVTAREEAQGESLDGLLSREVPDIRPEEGDGLGDTSDTDGEPDDWLPRAVARGPMSTTSSGPRTSASTEPGPRRRRRRCTSWPIGRRTRTPDRPDLTVL